METAIRKLLKKTRLNPFHVFRHSNRELADSVEFCSAFLRQCDEITFDTPGQALKRAFVAEELASNADNIHMIVSAMAFSGTGFRIEGCFSKAEAIYRSAIKAAKGCTCCLPNVYQRVGVLHKQRSNFDLAISYYNKALIIYDKLGDVDGTGRVLVSRALAFKELGKYDSAINDISTALMNLTRESPHHFKIAALTNKMTILTAATEGSKDSELLKAALFSVRRFRGHLAKQKIKYGAERVRATMRWCEALILATIGGHRNRGRAIELLDSAQKSFLGMGAIGEYLTVNADLAGIYRFGSRNSNSRQVREVARRCLRELKSVKEGDFAEITDILENAEKKPTVESITRWRDALGPSVPGLHIKRAA